MNYVINGKIEQKQLVNKSDIYRFINNFDLYKKLKVLATKAELKVEQGRKKKFQACESSCFMGQSYFVNDTS